MGRTILTEEQRELIALIPKAIRNSKDFTNAAKLVLAQLDLQDGTDFSETNHYVFSSNDDLMKNTGIGSKHTIIDAVKKLVNEGLIETKRGYRRKGDIKASEYVLTDKYYELGGRENPHKQGCNNYQNQGCNKGCNCTNSTNTVIEDMQQQINELREEIEKLQNALKKINCTSDTETDSDIELETCIQIHDCSIPSTGNRQEQTKNNMKIDERLVTQDEKDASEILAVSDDFDYTQYGDISEMVQSDAGVRGVKKNELSKYDRVNKWVSWAFDRLEWLIESYFQSWNKQSISMYQDEILGIIEKVHVGTNNGWFTDKQLDKFNRYINNYNSITSKKQEVLEKKNKQSISKNEQRQTAVSNVHIISDGMSESEQQCPRPAAPTKEEYLNALRKVFIEEEGWTLKTFYSRAGFGLYDYRKKVADILGVNVDRIDCYKFEKDIKAMLSNDMVVEEPIVPYDNNSINEAQQQFARALQKYA